MVAVPDYPEMSVDAYLELERHSSIKHEYIDGAVFAIAGGTPDHGVLAANLTALIRPHLRGRGCRLYSADVRIRLAHTRYVYRDLSIGCDPRDYTATEAIQYPCVVVEILSPSTEAYDRGRKFARYRALDSLREYVLVNADHMAVECYRRDDDGHWTLFPSEEDEELVLDSIAFRCPVAAIYEDVVVGGE